MQIIRQELGKIFSETCRLKISPSVPWCCWLGRRVSGMVIWLERGANDLHMVQLMPLPPIISYFIKIQNDLPFWCWLTEVVLEKGR